MKFSVVIPAFNEEKLLGGTLEAVRDSVVVLEEAGVGWELIVCDNNSNDRTAEVAKAGGARVVFEPVNQIARARNTGATVATGDWILFVDADSRLSRGLMAEALAMVGRGDVGYVGVVVRLDAKLDAATRLAVGIWNLLSRTACWMAGSFVLVEAGLFREVGGFDQRFYAGEEVDLSRRLRRAARRRGMRGAILKRHPLVTSARRMKLYTVRELGRFFLRALLRPWATTASREACGMWYDGRR